MRLSYILILLFSTINLFSQSLVSLQEGRTNATIISNTQYSLSFTSSLSGFDILGVKAKDGEYIRIVVPEYYPDKNVSNPELPVMTRLIEVPLDAEFEVRIKSFDEQIVNLNEYGIDLQILPNQPSVSKSTDYDKLPFYKNSSIYEDKEFYETQPVSVELLSKMRGIQIAQIRISPFSYDIESNTLIIKNNIEAEIIYKNADFKKTAQLKADKYSPAFGSAYNSLWNYKAPATKGAIDRYPIKYVIVSDRMFEATLNSFIKWKTKKGFYVTVAYTDEIGTTAEAIKAYLQGLYNAGTAEDPAPTYVLFVGDVAQVPYSKQVAGSGWFEDDHVTDMYYCEYDDGTDYIPEVYFGRFSASTVAHLASQIEKTLMFEQYTFPDPSFLGEAVLVAGVDNTWSPTHANGQVNYAHNYYFNADHGVTTLHKYLYPESGSAAEEIRNKLGQGIGYVNYIAHCDQNGWEDPSFTISHIPSLNNEDKYFFSVGNCCLSNKFEVNECFGEALVRANKKGAVAHIGSSNSTYWDENFYWAVGLTSTITANVTYEQSSQGAYDHLFHDRGEEPYPSAYEMIYAGNMAVESSTSDLKKYYWEIYHIMGDPSLMPYIGVPEQIQATYSTTMQVGMSSLTVNTEENAYVALSDNGVLLDAVLANSSGIAVLNFETLTTPGNLDIVITKQFRAPLIEQIMVVPSDNDYDAMLSSIIAPQSQIHINNASFAPSVEIMNLGLINLTSVTVGYILDEQEPVTLNWTGDLAQLETAIVNFSEITLASGNHTFTAFVSEPNGQADQFTENDQKTQNVLVYSGNVKIESIQSPEDNICNISSISPQITIKNMDSEPLSSCVVSYVCGEISDEFAWSGSLAQNETAQIAFPETSFPDGNNTITFTIETVNGGGNSANFGTSITKNFKFISVGNTIIFDITSNYSPSDNAWTLTCNETSELIYSESLSNANEHHITELCLGNGCYTFEITDSNGDGMNGYLWLPAGGVKITNSTTSEVLWEYTSNESWNSKTFDFCLDLTNLNYYYSEEYSICEGEIYYWHNQNCFNAGIYTAEYTTIHGYDSIYTLNLTVNPTFLEETVDVICDSDLPYVWRNTEYNATGVYNDTFTNVYGCDSIYTLNLTVNPNYSYSDTYSICNEEVYTWHGQTYSETGTYTAEYETVNGCDSIYTLNLTVNPTFLEETVDVICDSDLPYVWRNTEYNATGVYNDTFTNVYGCDSIYTLNLTVNPSYSYSETHSICNGEVYTWQGQTYSETGTYTAEYETVNGCDSIYTLNLTVNPLPQQVVILQTPENGILPEGTSGSIRLSTSIVGTEYWVTRAGALFTSEISGTGSMLDLGNYYPSGNYYVLSRNQFNCSLVQGIVNFTTGTGGNTGAGKIVANVSFGTPASSFPANHVNVKLYKKEIDINNNEVIIYVTEQTLGTNGQAEFLNLVPGDYYMGSFILYPDNYNVAEHVYYQTAVVHEEAISIPVFEETVFIANLHHVLLTESQGSNTMQGIVGENNNAKSLNPKKDMVVVLKNADIDEIIGVSVTNEEGQYHFEDVPVNANIQAFVTSFAHQNWTAFEIETDSYQTYNVNFIVSGTSVYPDYTTMLEDVQIQNIEFSVFPNPANDVLNINCNVEKAIVQIFDINGKLVKTELAFSNSEINISELVSGTYLIILSAENGKTGIQKFVKE